MLQSVIVTQTLFCSPCISKKKKKKYIHKNTASRLTYRKEHLCFSCVVKFSYGPPCCQTWPGSEFTTKQLLSFFIPAEAQ